MKMSLQNIQKDKCPVLCLDEGRLIASGFCSRSCFPFRPTATVSSVRYWSPENAPELGDRSVDVPRRGGDRQCSGDLTVLLMGVCVEGEGGVVAGTQPEIWPDTQVAGWRQRPLC